MHKKVADLYDKKFITPYLDSKVKEYFYSMDWYQLNEPYQKHHVRDAFDIHTDVKKHLNLQLESGVDELFENLLNNSLHKVLFSYHLSFHQQLKVII